MSEQKLFVPNMAVKLVRNTCKSPQTSTRCCSVTIKFDQEITWHLLNLIAQVLGLHQLYQ